MPNTLISFLGQGNFNGGINVADADSIANSGNNHVLGGLLAVNAGNPAVSTAAALNIAPVTQTNIAIDPDFIIDSDVFDIL